MKRKLMLFATFVLSMVILAEPVSKEEAMIKAQAFVNGKNKMKKVHARNIKLAHHLTKLTPTMQENTLYYVFNVGDCDGFVIISGDDRTPAVLGYTEKGTYDTLNTPDNMRAWLQGYVDQLTWLQQHSDLQNELNDNDEISNNVANGLVAVRTPTKNSIAPLMVTEWNQNNPYNILCPTDPSTNKTSMTGCVATAMAQVMFYHRWPEATIEKIPSYTTEKRSISIGAISKGTIFDWDNMLPIYEKSGVTADQQTAVATLMKTCGAAVQMDYASSESGAYLDPEALVTYFNYSKTIHEISRKNFSLAEWNNLIYAEIAENRPVLYAGRSSGGGHQFVVDGYDSDGLFHINWGWGGHQDGYFLLSVLNPGSSAGIGSSSTSDGYSFDQTAIIGVKPDNGEEATEEIKFTSSIISVSGNKIISSYLNFTNDTHTFNFGIGYINDDETITCIGNYRNFPNCGVGRGYDEYPFYVNGLPDGVYKIVPISKESDTDTWFSNVNSSKEYVEAVIKNGTVTLTLHKTVIDLDATSFNYSGNKKAESKQSVDVTIQNNGDEYYGLLYLFASPTDTKGSYQSRAGVTILENKSISTQFSFTPTSEGIYNIWVATNASGKNVIGTSSIDIGAASTVAPNLSHTSTVLNKTQNGNILGHSFTGEASFRNNSSETFVGSIRVRFLVNTIDNSYITFSDDYVPVEIPSGQTETINYKFSGLTPGKLYWIIYYYPNGNEIYRYSNFLCVAAPEVYQADGACKVIDEEPNYVLGEDVCAFNLSGVSGVTSVIGGNENTLFIFGANDIVPTSLNGRNIVKDGEAMNIVLQDGCDFYSPVTFTAQNISYTRTFETGLTRDYKNWTTITLPFTVSDVTVDLTGQGPAYSTYSAYPIDWFHNADDHRKNFWVMEFSSEENGIVKFTHADKIKAARPLIIAVPGEEWGSANDLTKLPITFHGQDVTILDDFRAITSGDIYKIKGIVAQKNLNDIFVINADGTAFTRHNSATVDAFRAYFEPTSTAATAQMLTMAFGDGNQGETTALKPVFDHETTNQCNTIYDLQGRKLNGEPTQKGIYIVNGKKFIKK